MSVDKSGAGGWDFAYQKRQWEQCFLDGQLLERQRKFKEAGNKFGDSLVFARQINSTGYRLVNSLIAQARCKERGGDLPRAGKFYGEAERVCRLRLKETLSDAERFATQQELAESLTGYGRTNIEENLELGFAKLKEAVGIYDELAKRAEEPLIARALLRARLVPLSIMVDASIADKNWSAAKEFCAQATSVGQIGMPPVLMDQVKTTYASLLQSSGEQEKLAALQASEQWSVLREKAHRLWRDSKTVEALETSKAALALAQNQNLDGSIQAISLRDTGQYACASRPWSEASKYLTDALSTCSGAGMCKTTLTDDILEVLASSAVAANDPKAAEYIERQLDVREHLYGDDSQEFARTLVLQAQYRAGHNDLKNSAEPARRACEILKNTHSNNRKSGFLLTRLGTILHADGENQRAEWCYSTAGHIFADLIHLTDQRAVVPRFLELAAVQSEHNSSKEQAARAVAERAAASLIDNQDQYYSIVQGLLDTSAEIKSYGNSDLAGSYLRLAQEVASKSKPSTPFAKQVTLRLAMQKSN